jgi:hypothetical protein
LRSIPARQQSISRATQGCSANRKKRDSCPALNTPGFAGMNRQKNRSVARLRTPGKQRKVKTQIKFKRKCPSQKQIQRQDQKKKQD